MTWTRTALLAALLPLVAGVSARAAPAITVYTENWPPFNFEKDGRVDGVATAIVRKVLGEAGLDYDILVRPWTRAYANALSDPNAMIYSMVRTKEREALFKWAVPLARLDLYLFGARNGTTVASVADLAKSDFTATCIIDDASCATLESIGIRPDNIERVPDNETGSEIQMVVTGRTDFYVAEPIANTYRLQQMGLDPTAVVPILRVSNDRVLYLAGNLKMDPTVADRIQKALARLVARGAVPAVGK